MKKRNRTTAGGTRKSGARKRVVVVDPVARLTTAFQELDETHRIVLCLHYLERLSLYQIARVLDDSEEAVKQVYLEAIEQLGSRPERVREAA